MIRFLPTLAHRGDKNMASGQLKRFDSRMPEARKHVVQVFTDAHPEESKIVNPIPCHKKEKPQDATKML